MTTDVSLHDEWSNTMLNNYGVPPLEISHGTGCLLKDVDGNVYLDLIAGIAVSTLGHGHLALIEAVSTQVSKLAHTSNLLAHRPGLDLARELLTLAESDGRVFFAQDGATANEAALKLARRYGLRTNPDGSRQKVVAARNSFHGRTMGALAVTGNPAKRDPFGPFGFDVLFVDYGNIEQINEFIDNSVCAVILEAIQGEGGIIVPAGDYLAAVRDRCDEVGALLIVDEVQSGIGRTGDWFLSLAQDVRPDIITLAKGLAGGFPLGAMIVEPYLADVFAPGDHGTTFGGNPVSCAAALAVIETIKNNNLLEHVTTLGAWFMSSLQKVDAPQIKEVRGKGLWIAIEFTSDVSHLVEVAARNHGFLVNAVKPNAIRIAPPLIITRDQLQMFIDQLPTIINAAVSQADQLGTK
jgi:acetylornithine aminotransferase